MTGRANLLRGTAGRTSWYTRTLELSLEGAPESGKVFLREL